MPYVSYLIHEFVRPLINMNNTFKMLQTISLSKIDIVVNKKLPETSTASKNI